MVAYTVLERKDYSTGFRKRLGVDVVIGGTPTGPQVVATLAKIARAELTGNVVVVYAFSSAAERQSYGGYNVGRASLSSDIMGWSGDKTFFDGSDDGSVVGSLVVPCATSIVPISQRFRVSTSGARIESQNVPCPGASHPAGTVALADYMPAIAGFTKANVTFGKTTGYAEYVGRWPVGVLWVGVGSDGPPPSNCSPAGSVFCAMPSLASALERYPVQQRQTTIASRAVVTGWRDSSLGKGTDLNPYAVAFMYGPVVYRIEMVLSLSSSAAARQAAAPALDSFAAQFIASLVVAIPSLEGSAGAASGSTLVSGGSSATVTLRTTTPATAASPTAAVSAPAASPVSVASTMPTRTPVATLAPIVSPSATIAPTLAPSRTPAPTPIPVATPAPSLVPGAITSGTTVATCLRTTGATFDWTVQVLTTGALISQFHGWVPSSTGEVTAASWGDASLSDVRIFLMRDGVELSSAGPQPQYIRYTVTPGVYTLRAAAVTGGACIAVDIYPP